MIRILALIAGLGAAGVTSQAPEFTQQYLQRLAGQVDALTVVVRDFDATALAAGYGREEALAQMTGTSFLSARQADMRATFARHARLTDHLTHLRDASPVARLAMPHRLGDLPTLRATQADFSPAVPLTAAGATAGAGGFVLGWGSFAALMAVLRLPFRRRAKQTTPQRREPILRPPSERATLRPELMGERR